MTSTLFDVLESSLADRIVAIRASHMPGSLFPLNDPPQKNAAVTCESLELNFKTLLPVLSGFAVPKVDVVKAAIKELDEQNNNMLSMNRTLQGQRAWVKHEAAKLLEMCRLVRRLQWRSPGRSGSENIRNLKLAMVQALVESDDDDGDWPDYPDYPVSPVPPPKSEDNVEDDSSDIPDYPDSPVPPPKVVKVKAA